MSREQCDASRFAARLGPGALALVVGPSGAGKDALIAGARTALAGDPRFVFPSRLVTRPPHAAEGHGSMTEAEFIEAARRGEFAFTWHAHGLHYGVPAGINRSIADGCVVVVNGSRTIASAVRRGYARSSIILIDCSAEIREARLALRGRESFAGVQVRMTRQVANFVAADADARIDNAGEVAHGQRLLVAALTELAQSCC